MEIENNKEKDALNKDILETIYFYNQLISSILKMEDISQIDTQKKIIHYQNKKTNCIADYHNIRRKEQIDWYQERLNKALTMWEINLLKEKLDRQKIEAEDDFLFFTDKEKEMLLQKMNLKLTEIDWQRSPSSMKKNMIPPFLINKEQIKRWKSKKSISLAS